MYDLPENPTAIDIIKRSVTCHPSMFADMLRARMNEDKAYAASRPHESAIKRAIDASAKATELAIGFVTNDMAEHFASHMGAGIIALNIACKLQALPPHIRTQAALRTWPE